MLSPCTLTSLILISMNFSLLPLSLILDVDISLLPLSS